MHKLTIEDDEGKTVVVPLIRDEITIGRLDGNTIRLTERNVSRNHAKLFRKEGGLWIEDLGSHTGVKVNGTRLSAPTALKDGDLVVVGDYRMTLKTERAPATLPYIPPLTLPGAGGPAGLAGQPGVPGASPPPGVDAGAKSLTAAAGAPLPPVETAMDGAPTIPVRTMMERQAPGARTPPARLIVMSTDLAGTELVLDRPSMVVGRTPENDLVINHKSISRHHAKIIRDGERFVVVDLESANGVRVNGTPHERMELSSGDVLELGHVRIRFAMGQDDFDADGFDASAFSGGGKTKTYALVGLGGAAAIGLAVFLFSGGSDKGGENGKSGGVAKTQPATQPASQTTATAGAGPAAAAIAEAKAAAADEKWPEALAAVSKAEGLEPASARVGAIRAFVERERQGSQQLVALRLAHAAKSWDAVLTAFSAIPDDSTYKARARPLYDEARTNAIAKHVAAARQHKSGGDCGEARREAETVLALDGAGPQAAGMQAIIDGCAKVAARAPEAERAAAPVREATERPGATAERPVPAEVARPPVTKPAAALAVAKAPPAAPKTPPAAQKAPPTKVATARPIAPAARPARLPAAAEPSAPLPMPRAAIAPASDDAPSGNDPEALLSEARQYYLRQQYSAAVTAAHKALRAKPGLTRAYSILAPSYCNMRDRDEAVRAYDKLDERERQYVKTLCQNKGITLD